MKLIATSLVLGSIAACPISYYISTPTSWSHVCHRTSITMASAHTGDGISLKHAMKRAMLASQCFREVSINQRVQASAVFVDQMHGQRKPVKTWLCNESLAQSTCKLDALDGL